jgi:hypothetical protein
MSTNVAMPDISMDSIESLGFEVPPQGRYLALLTIEPKTINGKGNLEFTYVVQETIELASPSDNPPKAGAKFSELFSYEKGLPIAKEKLEKISKALGLPADAKLPEIVEVVKGIGVELTLKHRKNPKGDDPEKVYASVPGSTFKVA